MSVSPPSRACLKRCARASKERPIRRRSRRRPSPTDWPACRYSMRSGVRPRRTARWSASILDAMSQTNSPAPAISPLLTLDVEVERSEEHTSELQSLMRISYAVFCLKKKNPATQDVYTHEIYDQIDIG